MVFRFVSTRASWSSTASNPAKTNGSIGIAVRQLQRIFVLVEGIEVIAAETDNGFLDVDLECPRPDARVRIIKIRKAPKHGGPVSKSLGAEITD